MDSLITAAARALAAGDPMGALNRVALRSDAAALALRGIAMAQLGDLARARILLRNAAGAFGAREALPRARCVVAEAEIALVMRDLHWAPRVLDAARSVLDAHGDRVNAAHARHLTIRRMLLIGQLDEAERALGTMDTLHFPPALEAAHELIRAGIAIRRVHAREAQAALARAGRAARASRIAGLLAEVESASLHLNRPAARLLANGRNHLLLLSDVELLLATPAVVVDACRHQVRRGNAVISLATRPVLFALVRTLAEAWPGDVPRDVLLARAFGARFADASHRARLRVEIARLRTALGAIAGVIATKDGFVLVPESGSEVAVLAWPVEEEHATVLALLADGEAWSSSSLALALGASQRTVQRATDALSAAGKVQAVGLGRARRWMSTSIPGFTTTLLLPTPLQLG
jgi:hypothetical protein